MRAKKSSIESLEHASPGPRRQNTGTGSYPVYHVQAYPESDRLQDEYHIRAESDVYGLPINQKQRQPNSVGSVGATEHLEEQAQLRAEKDLFRSRREAAENGRGVRQQHKQRMEEWEVQANMPPDPAPRSQDAFPQSAGRRQHHAGQIQFSNVRNMSPNEWDSFRAKANSKGNPTDAEMRIGHSKHKRHGRVLSSSLQIGPEHTPGVLRATRRASAFLEAAGEQNQASAGVSSTAEICGPSVEDDNALFPLYYLDRDGQRRDFLDPAPLKHAYRKLSVGGVGAVGSLFLGASISQQQLKHESSCELSESSDSCVD